MIRALRYLAVSCAFATATSAAQAAVHHLTMDDAIDAGIKNATLVLKSETAREITGADLLAAYGRFLPNFGASASLGYVAGKAFAQGAGVADARYTQAAWGVSTSINIFDGFGDVSNLHASGARDKASDYSLKRAKQQIAIDIAQAFLQVYLDNQITAIDEQNLRVSQERLKLLTAQRNVGSVSNADLFRQQAQTAQDESTVIDARERAHVDLLKLLQRIRIDAREDYVIDNPDVPEYTEAKAVPREATLIDDALKQRQDYAAQLERTNAAESDVTTAQKTYWPTLDLGATFGGQARDYSSLSIGGQDQTPATQPALLSQLGPQTEFTIGLNLNWAIFDRFITSDAVARANAASTDAKIDLDDLQKQVVVDVRQGYADYLAAAEQARTTKVGETAARQAFEVISGRYRVGSSSFLDLTAAQATAVQAQQQHIQALVNLKLRAESLLFFTGRDPRGKL